MSYENVARRYARAVFDIGKESGTLEQLGQDVAAFAALFVENAELRSVLDNPLIADASREAVIQEIGARMGMTETSRNLLRLLARRNRLAVLPELSAQLGRLVDDETSLLRAEVTSAVPLSNDYVARLAAELEKATGRKVAITTREDASLIAGIVTRIGDRVIDGSARARLTAFRDSLVQSS
jgi:F-type H+-transporting ATPase subunit delta